MLKIIPPRNYQDTHVKNNPSEEEEMKKLSGHPC